MGRHSISILVLDYSTLKLSTHFIFTKTNPDDDISYNYDHNHYQERNL